MGFTLTLLYLALTYLTPMAVVPLLEPYHVELWVAILAIACSVPTMLSDSRWQTPQLLFFTALLACIPASLIAGPQHWFDGAAAAIFNFLPSGIVFLLVVVNCRSVRNLKILTTMLLVIATYYICRGALACYAGESDSPFVLWQHSIWPGRALPRIRALSTLHDPNDFAQYILCLLPFIWLPWRAGKHPLLWIACGVPAAFLLWGMYLTHSRGAMVAGVFLLWFIYRRRFGIVGTGIAMLFAIAGLFALNFSGGRSVSLQSGADRLDLWGTGLALLKTSPVFGIGYNQFTGAAGLTAHNSFVLCLAELGLIGYFFWIASIVFTFQQLNGVIRAGAGARSSGFAEPAASVVPPNVRLGDEVQRFAVHVRLSLIAFLAAGWFLSRAYVSTFWLVLGMAVATVQIAKFEELPVEYPAAGRMLNWSMAIVFLSIAFVYAMLRARSFTR